MLSANELGEKGESRFREICADAKLICNKSDRDLAGWDFIVHFPFKDEGDVSLDSRLSPISCYVQVKTLYEQTNRFRMRLSSAERLAKENIPSFVYVFKVNEKLEFVESFLIHILDDTLGVILKRLRKEQASSGEVKKINKKEITLPVKKHSIHLNTTGFDFRRALESMCGDSMDAYIEKKSIQLKNLGFEIRPYELNATLHLGNDDEFVDALLGITKDIPASNLKAFQTRFGIKLPEHLPAGDAKISISPSAFDQCTLSFQQTPLDMPVVFEGDVFGAAIPGLPLDKYKVLVKTNFFSIELKRNELKITSNVDGETKGHLQEWLKYWNAIHVLSTGNGILKIQSGKLTQPIEVIIPHTDQFAGISTCSYWIDVCSKASNLIRRAGKLDEPIISMLEIEENSHHILLMHAMVSGVNCLKMFITESAAGIEGMEQVDAVWVDGILIDNEILACYGVAKFSLEHETDQVKWIPIGFEPKGIKVLSSDPGQYDELIEKAKKDFEISTVLAHRLIFK